MKLSAAIPCRHVNEYWCLIGFLHLCRDTTVLSAACSSTTYTVERSARHQANRRKWCGRSTIKQSRGSRDNRAAREVCTSLDGGRKVRWLGHRIRWCQSWLDLSGWFTACGTESTIGEIGRGELELTSDSDTVDDDVDACCSIIPCACVCVCVCMWDFHGPIRLCSEASLARGGVTGI